MDRQEFLKSLAEANRKAGFRVHPRLLGEHGIQQDKLRIEARRRRDTTLTIWEIFQRLRMGSGKSLNHKRYLAREGQARR